MAIKYLEHKWQKITAAILMLLLFLITVVAFFVNRYWSPILAEKVRSTVLESTGGLYRANFTEANLHIVQGKLIIHNFRLTPDMAVYNNRLRTGLAPNNLYTLKVKRIELKHIHPLLLYFHKKLDIGKIVLSAPELQMSYQLNQKHDTVAKNQLNTWQRIKGMLKSVHIGQVMLNDVKFMYKDYSGNELNISELKEMNLLGKDLLIDSTTQQDSSRYLYFKDIQLELNNFSQPAGNGLYHYKIKQLTYSSLTTKLQAYGVALIPAHDSVFTKQNINTWFSFDADTLRLNKFDFRTYNKYRLLNASKLFLSRCNLVLNTGPKSQGSKSNRLLSFPHVAVHNLNNNFTLDTAELQRVHITYKAYGKKSGKQGWISFNNTNGTIYNITNNADALRKNNLTRIQLQSYLMNSGFLQLECSLNLTDSARSYSYKGSVYQMNMDNFNDAAMPFALVKITSGKLNKLDFDIEANRYASKGSLTFLYQDLKVHILRMDTAANKYRHRAIASLFANALIVKRNNPDYLGSLPRIIPINIKRQPNTPFFKAIWQTLSTGIKASAGYDKVMEEDVRQRIAQHMAYKNKRQMKKALRKKRRAMRNQRRR
jgi:hypothetical protein